MPFVLIKNNLKLMLRGKWILFMMIILPLVTIALLSNAFQEMMNTDYTVSEFTVGYRIREDNSYRKLIPALKKVCKTQKILLQEYPEGDISQLLKNKTVAAFVEIKDSKSYQIFQSSDYKTEAAITESIFSSFFYQTNKAVTAATYTSEQGKADLSSVRDTKVRHEVLPTDPVPSSTDYYGIIYIVYFASCGMVSLVAVISSERKSAILSRMKVSHLSKFSFYLGKFLPCTLAIFIEIGTAWMISIPLFGIHWGNIGLSAIIIFLVSMASSAFGILLFQLFSNVAVSIVCGFVITWILGFFGGSFQTYMYAGLPQTLVDLCPIYYINRTLVEFSTMGHSDYTGLCIGILIGEIVLLSTAGALLTYRKLEEQ